MSTEDRSEQVGENPLADGMMSVAQAMEFTQLSKAELYAAMAKGALKFHNYGRRRLIAKRELLAWLRAALTASQS